MEIKQLKEYVLKHGVDTASMCVIENNTDVIEALTKLSLSRVEGSINIHHCPVVRTMIDTAYDKRDIDAMRCIMTASKNHSMYKSIVEYMNIPSLLKTEPVAVPVFNRSEMNLLPYMHLEAHEYDKLGANIAARRGSINSIYDIIRRDNCDFNPYDNGDDTYVEFKIWHESDMKRVAQLLHDFMADDDTLTTSLHATYALSTIDKYTALMSCEHSLRCYAMIFCS